MNYQGFLEIAGNKFNGEFNDVLNDIRKCISSGSTGGEISSAVGKYLKDLKLTNPIAYSLLESDIRSYIYECKKHGLEII